MSTWKESKWFNKWEFGMIEGLIIGVVIIALLSSFASPILILLFFMQSLTIFLLIRKGEKRVGILNIPRKNSASPPSDAPALSPLSIMCQSCGAKGMQNSQGKIWFPRHKQGCKEAQK
jgi:hypothetical protein